MALYHIARVEKIMSDLFTYSKEQSLVNAIAEYYGIPVSQIYKTKHKGGGNHEAVRPKQICQKLMFDHLKYTTVEIGIKFKCDHSTVSTNIRSINGTSNPALIEIIRLISAKVFYTPALFPHPLISKIEKSWKIKIDKDLNEALNRFDTILATRGLRLGIKKMEK